jgi:hypothetical protein
MLITFETDKDVIVYTLEMIISFCWERYLHLAAHSAWWLVSITGLYQGLFIHIDNLLV